LAEVPATTPRGAVGVLDLTDAALDGGAMPVTVDDGVHVAALLGDTTGNGGYSALDAQRVLRVAVGLDSGFSPFPLVDPVIIADITATGSLGSLDATRLLQKVVGLERPEIPPLPGTAAVPVSAGPWQHQFLLEVAAPRDAADPNDDLQVALPGAPALEPLGVSV
jgi:hypothetical protein